MSSSRYESQKLHPVEIKSRTLQKSKAASYRSQLHVLTSSRRRLRQLRSHILFPIVAAKQLSLHFITSVLQLIYFSVFLNFKKTTRAHC